MSLRVMICLLFGGDLPESANGGLSRGKLCEAGRHGVRVVRINGKQGIYRRAGEPVLQSSGCVMDFRGATSSTGNTAEIEEERRLLYVAMTRAKDHLRLILPQRFFAHQQKSNGDRHMYALRTRFIPAAILDRFNSCAWPEAPAAILATKKATPPVDVAARLRRMWR
jgi:hypothetical protein